MHLTVELLRTADGRLEGTVATDWGWERSFSGTLDLLRILEELEPPPDDPPTLIIHGDADKLVPIQQAEVLVKKLKDASVEAKLVTKPGAAHGWPDQGKDLVLIADWFDAYLKKPAAAGETR